MGGEDSEGSLHCGKIYQGLLATLGTKLILTMVTWSNQDLKGSLVLHKCERIIFVEQLSSRDRILSLHHQLTKAEANAQTNTSDLIFTLCSHHSTND